MADATYLQQSATAPLDWNAPSELSYGALVSHALPYAKYLPVASGVPGMVCIPSHRFVDGAPQFLLQNKAMDLKRAVTF